ncbi:hypothetical protein NW766_005192 [Fusarium irregulare]|uniref:Uncharacterized protein n=1 Tax=Fusarium irregulare TaxID=2494466 RepID=A0A9W8PRL8_9HYPO|nr:hypothetical protein NW766_005192 [Fusarium irregulare]
MSVCMMAVELKWWRVGFVRVTDGVWGPTLGEGYRHKEWDIPCMRMISPMHVRALVTEEDVAEESNKAVVSVNTIFVELTVARLQGLDHPTSVLITGVLQRDATNPGRQSSVGCFEVSLKSCSVRNMLVDMLDATTRLLRIQINAYGTEEAIGPNSNKQWWAVKMRCHLEFAEHMQEAQTDVEMVKDN